MPTYEYACRSCKRHVEAVQSFSDPPLTECPHCGGELKRVFHPVGIVLKGSGFYSTDNRSGAKSKLPGGKEGGKEGGKDAGKDTGADSPKTDAAASTTTTATPAKESAPAKKQNKKPGSKT